MVARICISIVRIAAVILDKCS